LENFGEENGKNTYTHEGQTYSEDFEIFNGDQYFRYGVFKFNIVYFEQTIDGINLQKNLQRWSTIHIKTS